MKMPLFNGSAPAAENLHIFAAHQMVQYPLSNPVTAGHDIILDMRANM